ncbi:hypothetical protein LTR64_008709 [Lithohypha guttulata]|uniref:uncharacterized protein n=1 Tax=Lithohypha guttulata TaxID=1690604 RepID=UPI002DDE8B02|nr:hypothetical protein LTR51_008684 [Lithohypha guttulata]
MPKNTTQVGLLQRAAELLRQSQLNGYTAGAHAEKDATRGLYKTIYKGNTRALQEASLECYQLWRLGQDSCPGDAVTENDLAARYLYHGCENLSLAELKDFLRYKASIAKGRITDKMTTDSLNTFAEAFFAGFQRYTGNIVSEEDRSEVYNWVRSLLVQEGVVQVGKMIKYNCTDKDVYHLLSTVWTNDHVNIFDERSRIQFTFIIQLFASTGARIGAFFPNDKNETKGLRWKDVQVVLLRRPDGQQLWTFKLDQRFVKNNKHPDTITQVSV